MTTFALPSPLSRAVEALEKDLLSEDGPQISTVRNYNFAILPYDPEDELALRRAINELCERLRDAGWNTGTIPLHSLLLQRLRAQGQDFIDSMVAREKKLSAGTDPTRGLRTLKERVVSLIEGPEGIAADVIREVEQVLAQRKNADDRTVIFLARAGALYPFFRTSALLKHVAGHTHNVPVVLLYPGKLVGETGLSFMGVLPADRDYRPRIYR
jgi:Domain of unknown function (DUF1788)